MLAALRSLATCRQMSYIILYYFICFILFYILLYLKGKASLAQVPRDWSSEHEVAWTWLWENVERLVRSTLGKPQAQEP